MNNTTQNTGAGNRSLQNTLLLVEYLEQTIRSLEHAASLEQSSGKRGAMCEHFAIAISALKTKLAQELVNLKGQ